METAIEHTFNLTYYLLNVPDDVSENLGKKETMKISWRKPQQADELIMDDLVGGLFAAIMGDIQQRSHSRGHPHSYA